MWPHVRAVLITGHLVAITLMGFPAPDGAYDRAAWKDPTAQAEFATWAGHLGTTPETLEEQLWDLSQTYTSARDRVLAPFGPYYEYCGTGQSWRMFAGPHKHPPALHIDVRESGAWRPVYIERDPHHRWLGRVLDSYRFRSVIFRMAWPVFAAEYAEFAQWIARLAERDFPHAEAVRVRFYKAPTPTPDEVLAGQRSAGEFTRVLEIPLGGNR